MPLATRTATRETLRSVLEPLGIAPVVVESMWALASLAQAVRLSRASQPPGSVLFDPHAFTEELHWCKYQLACHPGRCVPTPTPAPACPIRRRRRRRRRRPHPRQLRAKPPRRPGRALAAPRARRQPARARPPPGPACSSSRTLVPDFPRNLAATAVLLALLRHHLLAAAVDYPSASDQRPALLWLCLLGDNRVRTADANEARSGSDRYDRTVYQSILVDAAAATAGVFSEQDLALCRVFDLKMLHGAGWDNTAQLRRIVAG